MSSPFVSQRTPLLVGALAVWMFAGCGGQEAVQGEEQVILTAEAQLNQADIDSFTNSVRLRSCTFVVAAGMATFTPTSELSQVLYGDPNADAHKLGFSVPVLSSGGAKISLTHLNAEMDSTGLTLTDSTATVKLSFDGLLHLSAPVPIIGSLSTDIQINSSSVSVALFYDPLTERVQARSVTSHLAFQAKNCGILGWCNHLVDTVLNSNLLSWAGVPLREAITRGLDGADTTARLDNLLVAGYNLKDQQTTPWTMVPSTLNLTAGAFHFTAQRNSR